LNYKKNGEKFWNQFYLSPIKCCNNGKVIHYVGIQTDVSDCVKLQHCDSGLAVLRSSLSVRREVSPLTSWSTDVPAVATAEALQVEALESALTGTSRPGRQLLGYFSVQPRGRMYKQTYVNCVAACCHA
jgi:hypothetical protein